VTATGNIGVSGTGITRVGGAVGQAGGDGVTAATADIDIAMTLPGRDPVSVGGLIGYNQDAVSESTASGAIRVDTDGTPVVGGLIGVSDNTVGRASVSDVSASGAITVETTAFSSDGQPGRVGGLIGQNDSPVTQGFATGSVAVTSNGAAMEVGGFVGAQLLVTDSIASVGAITQSGASGPVNLLAPTGEEMRLGGFAGFTEGLIFDAFSEGPVVFTETGADSVGFASDMFIGGFAGRNEGDMARTAARGGVVGTADLIRMVMGGHTGGNLDSSINDSYAAGAQVSGSSDSQQVLGGFVGATSGGEIGQVFAIPEILSEGAGEAITGGLIGVNGDRAAETLVPTTTVTGGFWDLDRTGQADSGFAAYGTGLATAILRDTDAFLAVARIEGWDFATVWAPGDSANDPALYSIDPVVFAEPDPVTLVYGTAESITVTGTVFGGPDLYVFGPEGDSLVTSGAFDAPVFSAVTVGTQRVSVTPGPLTSDLGQGYRSVAASAAAEITPAPLLVTPDDQSKVYGTAFTFDGTEFTTSELFYADEVTGVALTSAGAVETADVAGAPYAITGSDAVGTGLENYDVTFAEGVLSVTPLLRTVTIDDQSKVYGTAFTFDGTEFTAPDLLFDDALTRMDLSSAGAVDTAGVAGAPYAITGTVAEGVGIGNYALVIDDGSMDVTPAPLLVTPDDQSKTYGELFTFDGTEFVATGLLFSDAVSSLTLTSAGAVNTADVAGAPYAITGSDAVGTGLENYDVSFAEGALSVTTAPLTITPQNQSKLFGELFTFDGTEFTATGLLLSDVVSSLTLTSAGAEEGAAPDGSPYAISGSAPVGTGLGNYDITLGTGNLVVEGQAQSDAVPLTRSIESLPPNATDDIRIGFGSGGAAVDGAREVLVLVQTLAATLEIAADACAQNLADADRYLACLSDALEAFADELDAISTDLPPGMENVAQIVRTARAQTDQARARATSRLAGATSEAERDEIRRDALNEARAAIGTASAEIRKAIDFARADDPELAALQSATVTTVAAAVDSVGIKLSRAVGL